MSDRGAETTWKPSEPAPDWLEENRRPEGVDDATVEALGKLGEAVERLERARGHLYTFHQMCGTVDLMFGDAADLLRTAGHLDHADALERHIVGRNVLDGRWSFQIVEEYDATYWSVVRDFAEQARHTLLDGANHVYESEMKERRRSHGLRHHESRPPDRRSD
ncbi:MAG: hypothetical protein ACE37B_06480 [Ilumatobacter sp.]|jgi:hypothetical protein|uniref:hypothetical protein n=1 Tax=Ilumatobacter sp. TaxID=1967498 RepID=UPI00391DC923